jgi:hypothetical protein
VDRGIDLLFGNVWLCPVEDPPFIGAGCDAVPATDAPVVIHHHNSIRLLPCGMDRAYLYTGRILTLLTLNRKIDESFFWNQIRGIIMFRVFEIDQVSSLEPENPDPLKLRVMARMIVFFHAGIDTSPAANASRKLQTVSPESFGNGFLRADLKFPSIFLQVPLLQLRNDAFLIFFGHFLKMFL